MIEIPASLALFVALLLGTFSGGLFMSAAKEEFSFKAFIAIMLFLLACYIGGLGYNAML